MRRLLPLICSLGLIWLLAAGPAGAAPAAPQHDEKPSIVTADPPAEAGHGIAPNDEAQGEAAPPEAGHGGAGHDDGHGAPAGDVGSIVKGVMEHHLTDSGHIELPLVAFHMDRVRIPLPFFNGLYQATREGNPLINWMVKAEDGRAYLIIRA